MSQLRKFRAPPHFCSVPAKRTEVNILQKEIVRIWKKVGIDWLAVQRLPVVGSGGSKLATPQCPLLAVGLC